VHTLTEEHTWRTVKLRYYNTLSTIEDERTTLSHIRDKTEVHILYYFVKILVLGVCTVKLKLRLERYTIRQTTLQTLLNSVTRLVDVIVNKLQNKVVSGVCNREILVEHSVEALVLTILGRSVKLEEISE
jgi:hypothetical protein